MSPVLRLVAAFMLAGLAAVALAGARGRPRAPTALPLDASGVEGSPTLRDASGNVLAANLRVVEPGRLLRASSFPVNSTLRTPQGRLPYPAALVGREWFDFLRAHRVRTVVTLDPRDESLWAEDGYYDYWAKQTGYEITVVRVSVPGEDAYGRNERSGLRAGAELVRIVRRLRPEEGAVLVHGESGKDATGVAVAVYEMWRDRGWMDPDALWKAVLARYQASDGLLRDAGPVAGTPARCASGQTGYVCPEWLGPLRHDMEFIARL